MSSTMMSRGGLVHDPYRTGRGHAYLSRDGRGRASRGGATNNNPTRHHHHHSHQQRSPLHSYQKPILNDNNAWRSWSEVKVKVIGAPSGLPSDTATAHLYDLLAQYGTIVKIEIVGGTTDMSPRVAYVLFNPPPKEPFWQRGYIATLSGYGRGWIKAELQDSTQLALRSNKPSRQIYENLMVSQASCLSHSI